MKKFNIILLILWLVVIFMFSSDHADESSKKSDGIANYIVSTIENITGHKFKSFNKVLDTCIVLVRKSAHFLEYMVLGILVINVIKDIKILEIKYIVMAIIFCMLYSISDEIHQLFVPGRAGRIFDCFIDTLGSTTGILLYYLRYRKKIKQ